MCQHVDLDRGFVVAVAGAGLHAAVVGERGSDSSVLLSHLGLQPLPHLAMLAFDRLERGLWRKPTRLSSLGP